MSQSKRKNNSLNRKRKVIKNCRIKTCKVFLEIKIQTVINFYKRRDNFKINNFQMGNLKITSNQNRKPMKIKYF